MSDPKDKTNKHRVVQQQEINAPTVAAEQHKQLHESDEEIFAQLDSVVFKRFLFYARPYKSKMIIAAIAVLGFTLANLAVPLIVKFGIDNAILEKKPGLIIVTSIALIITACVYWLTMYFQRILITVVALRVLYDIRADMFLQLQRLGMSFSDKTPVGALMARMFGDVGNLQEMLEHSIETFGDILTLFGIIIILLWLDIQLGLITLGIIPLLFLVRVVWLPFARRAFLRMRRNATVVGVYLDQNVTGIRLIQATNRQVLNHEIMMGKIRTFFSSVIKAARLGGALMPTIELLTGISLALVLIIGGGRVLDGSLEIGVMIAFLLYVQRFFEPIRTLTMHYAVLQRAVASGHRIFELLDIPIEVRDKKDAVWLSDINGRLEFKNVTFGYNPDRPILKDISFSVEPGETLAIVGPTGSGKTSITSLAHRFYDIQKGSILIDGIDIRDVTQESIGGVVGMVLQEPFLFSQTVFENIRYNTLSATDEEVIDACKIIGSHNFIMDLEYGYETILEQRGSNLSVGQRQLLSFARALVANPKILILDEATANIDSYTERIVQKALVQLLSDRTAIVIAHRLSTIRDSSRIMVLNQGEIIEQGTHDQLVKKDGMYAHLWSTVYSSFDDVVENSDEIIAGPAAST